MSIAQYSSIIISLLPMFNEEMTRLAKSLVAFDILDSPHSLSMAKSTLHSGSKILDILQLFHMSWGIIPLHIRQYFSWWVVEKSNQKRTHFKSFLCWPLNEAIIPLSKSYTKLVTLGHKKAITILLKYNAHHILKPFKFQVVYYLERMKWVSGMIGLFIRKSYTAK